MIERLIDISEEPARLSLRLEQLVIRTDGAEPATIPLDEIAALVVSHPQVTYTHAALAGLVRAGAAVVICDSRHLPSGLLLPLTGHSVQAERFAQQAAVSRPTRKRLWGQIVQAKVTAQGRLLEDLHGRDQGLPALARTVRSGDPDNVEARASRRYWPALFADPHFRRDPQAEDQNRFLNYGYAVLRAVVARALCAAGLHPSLGLHHHNRYDAFCLADDLMEPFRPLVDRAVVRLLAKTAPEAPLDRETKAGLLAALTGRLELGGESRTLFDILGRVAASLAAVFAGSRAKLALPDFNQVRP